MKILVITRIPKISLEPKNQIRKLTSSMERKPNILDKAKRAYKYVQKHSMRRTAATRTSVASLPPHKRIASTEI